MAMPKIYTFVKSRSICSNDWPITQHDGTLFRYTRVSLKKGRFLKHNTRGSESIESLFCTKRSQCKDVTTYIPKCCKLQCVMLRDSCYLRTSGLDTGRRCRGAVERICPDVVCKGRDGLLLRHSNLGNTPGGLTPRIPLRNNKGYIFFKFSSIHGNPNEWHQCERTILHITLPTCDDVVFKHTFRYSLSSTPLFTHIRQLLVEVARTTKLPMPYSGHLNETPVEMTCATLKDALQKRGADVTL